VSARENPHGLNVIETNDFGGNESEKSQLNKNQLKSVILTFLHKLFSIGQVTNPADSGLKF